MIPRLSLIASVTAALRRAPVVALVGPRQCGKTTLARQIARGRSTHYFDLEDPTDSAKLAQPKLALADLRGLVIIDEVQRKPELLPLLRVFADRRRSSVHFLLLGSAASTLIHGVSESLAGRVRWIAMGGFDMREVGEKRFSALWLRGGFPRSFTASSEQESYDWRNDFVKTFLERDIPQLGISIPAFALRRFWTMVAHYHGQIWNAAEFARSIGSSEPTARRYLDILAGAYVVRQLPPWFENIAKRQVKAPKIYIRDSGILHTLLGLRTRTDLSSHPKYGASWEGFAIEQIISLLQPDAAYFWATYAGAELDLLTMRRGRRFGFELKCTDAPSLTRSMEVALHDLHLHHLWVVYPGRSSYRLHRNITAIPLTALSSLV